ncbi:unnamed protein product, partial [Closterium sp. NIES-54]
VVDGKLSQTCYTKALDHCYQRFCEKYAKKHGSAFSLGDTESVVFHSPYNKLVQKSLARLVFNDVKRGVSSSYLGAVEADALQPFVGLDEEKSLTDRDLEKTAMRVAGPVYSSKVGPTTLVGKRVGNMYCASLYGSLASLLAQQGQQLEGRRILLFSYGSGLMSTLFSLTVRQAADPFSLATLTTHLDVHQLLESRTKVTPEEFVKTMHLMESRYGACSFTPATPTDCLQPGTYYLTQVDDLYRRSYARKGLNADNAAVDGAVDAATNGVVVVLLVQSTNAALRWIAILAFKRVNVCSYNTGCAEKEIGKIRLGTCSRQPPRGNGEERKPRPAPAPAQAERMSRGRCGWAICNTGWTRRTSGTRSRPRARLQMRR